MRARRSQNLMRRTMGPQRSRAKRHRVGLGAGLTARGRAVLKAFYDARRYAPGFVVACGVLPEVSESASERLHTIVREVAERHLNSSTHFRSLQRRLRGALHSAEATDRVERHLTEL